MSLPAMTMDFVGDDFDLGMNVRRDPFGAYEFQARDPAQLAAARHAGSIPWWTDLEFHQAFFRPLSSLSLALDFALWPSTPAVMHLENALLFALIVLIAGSIYEACGLPTRVRGMATLFFALQAGQSMTIGWISARNTLLYSLFGFLSVRLFIAARGSGAWLSRIGGWLAFAAALASGEGGIAALAYLGAHILCFSAAAGAAPTPAATSPRRALAMLSGYGIVLVAWASVYVLGDYGVHNAGFYVDPRNDPVQFLSDLARAIPIYLATQLTLPMASLSVAAPWALPITTALCVAILHGTRRLWLPWVRDDARARFFGLGALLAVVPLGASPAQDRLVSFIALGICGLLALIIEERLGSPANDLPRRGAQRLLLLHTIWAALLFYPNLFSSASMVAGGGAILLDERLGPGDSPVIMLNAPSTLPPHFVASKRRWYEQATPSIELLYAGASELWIERPDEHSLILTAERGYFVGKLERYGRVPERHPIQPGDTITTNRMRAQVLAAEAGAPKRVRFDFQEPLTNYRVLAWQGRNPDFMPLPKLGERVRIQAAAVL